MNNMNEFDYCECVYMLYIFDIIKFCDKCGFGDWIYIDIFLIKLLYLHVQYIYIYFE